MRWLYEFFLFFREMFSRLDDVFEEIATIDQRQKWILDHKISLL